MFKKVLRIGLAIILVLGILATMTFAADKRVSVKLPSFSVYFNEIKVDSWHKEYPLIVYKDITYVPMTYYDSRFLGLESQWQGDTGLKIERTNITAAFREDYRKAKNLATYSATIPNFPVMVNGKVIDNIQEKYPLLSFRDVTYFPLTWRFAVEEFGWNYSFDAQQGLRIDSNNKKLNSVSLPNYQGQGLMIMGENYVYQGKDGIVYLASRSNPEKAQKIYQLPPAWINEKDYTRAGFYKDNEEYFMTYHTGGATMGTDHYYKIKTDGQVEKVLGGNNYSTSKFYNGLQIIAQQGVPPYNNNLVIFDGKEARNIGNPDYIYAWATKSNNGVSSSKDIFRVEDDLYLLAIDSTKGKDKSKIYRLNLNSNDLTLVSDIDTTHFTLEDKIIYFSNGNNLYKTDINDGKPELLTPDLSNGNSFQILKGQVYYVNGKDQKLYRIGLTEPLNETGNVSMLARQDQYVVVTFEEEANNPSRFMVFGGDGECFFRTADVPTMVSIDQDVMVYAIDDSGKIFTTRLSN